MSENSVPSTSNANLNLENLEDDELFTLEKDKTNFVIKPLDNKISDVWKYYGQICHKSGSVIGSRKYTNKIYCIQCFENTDKKNPIFKGYSKSTSSTVLYQHLSNAHKIERASCSFDHKQKRLAEMFFGEKTTKKFKSEDEQLFLNRRFSLWITRDLLPFSLVENEGFKTFWSSVLPKMIIPTRATLSRDALDDNYACFKKKLIDVLEKSPTHAAIAFDAWTDRFKKHSYITFTYHYMDDDWKMKSTVLKTSRFDHPHNFETLKKSFESTLLEYNLIEKKLCAITDGGPNMIKCVLKLGIERIACIAHSTNRLIQHDLMSNEIMADVNKIVNKLKKTQRKLCFKYTELKQKCEEDRQLKLFEMLDSLSKSYELWELENQYIDEEQMEYFDSLEKEFEKEVEKNESNFRGLYSANPVRWGCLYNTIECHLEHQCIIRCTLESIEAYDLILSKDEVLILNGIATILKPFNEFTKIIQGVQYPTINLIPLLYTHIEDQLESIRLFTTETIIHDAINILLLNMPHRIVLTEEAIAAACLDPSIQHLPIIDTWLNEKDMTRAQLVRKIIKKWEISLPDLETSIQENRIQNRGDRSTNAIGSLISNLVSKHTDTARLQKGLNSSIESELNTFRDTVDGIAIDFWKEKAIKFPNLAAVAKVLLAIPITNAKAEGAFSIAGCALRDKRARLDPLKAEKILFIHDNYDLMN